MHRFVVRDGIAAPLVLNGALGGQSFLAYVRQCLAPAPRPGDVLVMDKLSRHKVAGVREAAEAAGATLRCLPPCSPDLNPIEQVFAKLKTLPQKAATWTIGRSLDQLLPAEWARCLAHCGCGQSG